MRWGEWTDGTGEAATIAGGWRFVIDDAKTLGELPRVAFDQDWRGDGMITFRMTDEEARAWHEAGIPVVNLSSEGPTSHSPRVLPDNHQAGCLAAKHLADAGLANFAFVGRQTSLHARDAWASGLPRCYSAERWKGFCKSVEQRGLEPRFHLLSGHELWRKNAWKAIRSFASPPIRPSAVSLIRARRSVFMPPGPLRACSKANRDSNRSASRSPRWSNADHPPSSRPTTQW